MTRRVEPISAEALGETGRRPRRRPDLGRHLPRRRRPPAAGARARDRARPGVSPCTTASDSEDLMNLARHRLALLAHREPLPDQGHLPRDLLAGGQRPATARAAAGGGLSLVPRPGRPSSSRFSRPTSRRSRRRTCSTTTTCCSTGRRCSPTRPPPRWLGLGLRPRAGRRVPGHQPAAGRDPRRAEARRPRRHRGRRRRAGDLRLPRRGGAQHPRLPRPVRAPGADRHARAQLPLDRSRSWRRRTR